MPNPNNFITFRSFSPNLVVSCLLDTANAQITDGYGGWTEVDRARRRSVTMYTGPKTYKMTIPILFDGFSTDTDQMPFIKILEAMASPGDGITRPPVVHIRGAVPGTGLDWVINNITWGSNAQRNHRGVLVRQDMVVELWQYTVDQAIKSPAAKSRAKSAKTRTSQGGQKSTRSYSRTTYGYSPDASSLPQANTVYTSVTGDTMTSIASTQLGDWQAWKDIAEMNSLRDPNQVIAPGTKLRLPSP